MLAGLTAEDQHGDQSIRRCQRSYPPQIDEAGAIRFRSSSCRDAQVPHQARPVQKQVDALQSGQTELMQKVAKLEKWKDDAQNKGDDPFHGLLA